VSVFIIKKKKKQAFDYRRRIKIFMTVEKNWSVEDNKSSLHIPTTLLNAFRNCKIFIGQRS